MPSPGHPLSRQAIPAHLALGSENRDQPELLGDQATHGVDLILLEVDIEGVGEVIDIHGGRDAEAAIP